MKKHKFLIANPCGPCEWHIETDIRIFAWFDLIFQAVFVVPVILQLKIFLSESSTDDDSSHTNSSNTTTTTTKPNDDEMECKLEQVHLAILYSILDIVNLSLGIVADIIVYAGAKQKGLTCSKVCVWIFLLAAVIRESLHATGISLHVIRCSKETYAYEFVVRLLCQYMIYGIWIALEYLIWLNNGRLFVPRRGQMEPPVIAINVVDETDTMTTLLTSSTDLLEAGTPTADMSTEPSGMFGTAPKPEGDAPVGKKRKSKRRSKPKTEPQDDQQDDSHESKQ